MTKKKVLIITYYWPPSGGSGVQRWLKFVKYLHTLDCEPIVFTPENPSFAIRDESLVRDIPEGVEVIKFPIWEPYDVFFKIWNRVSKKKKENKPSDLVSGQKRSLLEKFSIWVRGNVFIPDPKIFWVRPSVKFLGRYIAEHGITNVITTGPPHSVHLIGYNLKKRHPSLNWIADFRDPWSGWRFLESMNITKIAWAIYKRLELKVLGVADQVITTTPSYARQFEALLPRRIEVLTNGFDDDDFRSLRYQRPEKFLIRHIGSVSIECNPRPFMEALKQLLPQQPVMFENIRIEFIGEVNHDFVHYVSQDPYLEKITVFTGTISHEQLLGQYGASSVLLLVLHGYKDAEACIPGKLFEYIATGLPVLGIGPPGDAADLLMRTHCGVMVDALDSEKMKSVVLQHYHAWALHQNGVHAVNDAAKVYSRKAITTSLIALLK